MKESKSYIPKTSRDGININKNLDLGKLPPQALDLEESVLGALMLEKDALTDVIDILRPENFYKDANKEIYQAIIDLFNNSEPVDLLTVTAQLKKNGKLDFSISLPALNITSVTFIGKNLNHLFITSYGRIYRRFI